MAWRLERTACLLEADSLVIRWQRFRTARRRTTARTRTDSRTWGSQQRTEEQTETDVIENEIATEIVTVIENEIVIDGMRRGHLVVPHRQLQKTVC